MLPLSLTPSFAGLPSSQSTDPMTQLPRCPLKGQANPRRGGVFHPLGLPGELIIRREWTPEGRLQTAQVLRRLLDFLPRCEEEEEEGDDGTISPPPPRQDPATHPIREEEEHGAEEEE